MQSKVPKGDGSGNPFELQWQSIKPQGIKMFAVKLESENPEEDG